MEKLLIASANKGKVKEISEMLSKFGIEVLSIPDFDIEEPEETGDTFEANAILKAEYYGKHTGLSSLADDSGLAVEALDGRPGVYSARWAGEGRDFNIAMEKVKKELAIIDKIDSPASFICSLAFWVPGKKARVFEGRVDGKLQFPPKGDNGFGYDPIFVPEGYNKTFAEFDPEEKNKMSHRAKAFEKFVEAVF